MKLLSNAVLRLTAAATLLVTLSMGAGKAVANDGCNPSVRHALEESALRGIEAEAAIVRHTEQGIRNPDSIFDFSCLDRMFDFRKFDMLFDPGQDMAGLLGLVKKRICSLARDAYTRYVGRELDLSFQHSGPLRLPGLKPPDSGEVRGGPDGARFRGLLGGAR